MPEIQLNTFAIIAASAVHMAFGALWYSPILFGKLWAHYVGKTEEEIKNQGTKKAYIGTFIGAAATAFALALFIFGTGASSVWDGCMLSFTAWFGFVATTTLDEPLFSGRPFGLYLLNNGFRLISMLLMGTILTLFP